VHATYPTVPTSEKRGSTLYDTMTKLVSEPSFKGGDDFLAILEQGHDIMVLSDTLHAMQARGVIDSGTSVDNEDVAAVAQVMLYRVANWRTQAEECLRAIAKRFATYNTFPVWMLYTLDVLSMLDGDPRLYSNGRHPRDLKSAESVRSCFERNHGASLLACDERVASASSYARVFVPDC
jgi:hypothetical protein